MTEQQKTIHELVTHSKKDVELASILYKLIEAAPNEDQVKLFKQALLEFKYTSTDNEWQLKSIFDSKQEEFTCLENARTIMEWDLLPCLRQQNLSEDDFNKRVWEYISDRKQHLNEKDQYMLMYVSLANKSLPYIRKEDLLTMTRDEFKSSMADINPTIIAQIEHIFKQDFEQFTEEASMFIRLFDHCESEKEKAILFSIILMRFKGELMFKMLDIPHDCMDDEDE